MSNWHIAALTALGFALPQVASADPIIHSQAWLGTSVVYASQINANNGASLATSYDDFRFGSAQRVTDVHWTGGFFNPSQLGDISSFTISFHADSAGRPGATVYTTTIAGDANATSLGAVGGNPFFSYDVDLATDFLADADTRYWISIVPTMPFPPQWGLGVGMGGNGVGFQIFSGIPLTTPDLAFSLSGTAQLPEPGSLALAGLALAALGAMRRRTAG